jgi:hypothetical protein
LIPALRRLSAIFRAKTLSAVLYATKVSCGDAEEFIEESCG